MRVVRKPPSGELEESRQLTAINGKPIRSDKRVALPLTFSGGFDYFPSEFFTRERRQCFVFTLVPHPAPGAPLELSITLNPDSAELPQCKPIPSGLTALARIDRATHQLMHLEKTFPPAPEAPKSRIVFVSVDLAPTRLGQNTFWLPTTLTANAVNGKDKLSWISRYSGYHQFTATTTILPLSAQ